MEKVYGNITKVLLVCIVITIVCTIFRVKTLDSLRESTDKIGQRIESITESNEELGDVEGYALLLDGLALGAGAFATAMLWAVILGIGFIIVVIFTVGIIFMQICKALETSIDPEKWKMLTSKILFIIYAVVHAFVLVFDILFSSFYAVDAIVVAVALVINLYLYVTGRKKEKLGFETNAQASQETVVDDSKVEVITEEDKK